MAALTTEQKEAKKAQYDKELCTEICSKIKKKMRFSINVEGTNGHKLTKAEAEAIQYGFNEAIRLSFVAVDDVLKEYGV